MDWIWQNYSTENIYICDYIINPYFEVRGDYYSNNIFYINTMIRFDGLFENLSSLDEKSVSEYCDLYEFYEKSKSCSVNNIVVHYLAHLDMLDGISADKVIMDIIRNEINDNLYGKEVNRLFNSSCVTEDERELILWLLLKRYKNDRKEPVLGQIFTSFFDTRRYAVPCDTFNQNVSYSGDYTIIGTVVKPSPEVYYRKSNETVYYYCASIKGFTDKFQLLRLLFSDIEENIIDVWGKCFGLIGNNNAYTGSYPEIGNFRLI